MKAFLASWKPWVVLAMLLMQGPVASAQPAGTCQELASRFAADPGLLDASALVALSHCVSRELAQRTGASVTAPPPPSVAPAAAREWGEWPERAPWSTREWPSYGPSD